MIQVSALCIVYVSNGWKRFQFFYFNLFALISPQSRNSAFHIRIFAFEFFPSISPSRLFLYLRLVVRRARAHKLINYVRITQHTSFRRVTNILFCRHKTIWWWWRRQTATKIKTTNAKTSNKVQKPESTLCHSCAHCLWHNKKKTIFLIVVVVHLTFEV